ncbi:MAG: hypothetical protein KJ648_07580 [Candidatus Omnitrophica bacterium]|nr:hypothetical protein [Candidatus Omnitrophota bacterium]
MKTKKTKLDRQVTRLAEKALKESAVLADQIDASITETQSRDKTKKQLTPRECAALLRRRPASMSLRNAVRIMLEVKELTDEDVLLVCIGELPQEMREKVLETLLGATDLQGMMVRQLGATPLAVVSMLDPEAQDQALELLQAEHDKRLAEKYAASGPTVRFDLSGLAPDALVKAEAALRLVNEANALEQLKVAYNNIPDQGTWSFFPHTRLSLQRLHAVRHAGNTLLKIHPEAARYCELKALNILVTLRRDLARYMKVVRDQIGQLEGSSATWALAGGPEAKKAKSTSKKGGAQ